jgi:hypothetical protein
MHGNGHHPHQCFDGSQPTVKLIDAVNATHYWVTSFSIASVTEHQSRVTAAKISKYWRTIGS